MAWQIKKLGEICSFTRGLTYKKSDEAENGTVKVLRANNITLASGELNFDEIKSLRDDLYVAEDKFVRKDSLLICTASGSKKHLGKVAFIDQNYRMAFGGFMGMLTPNELVIPKYLYWLTQSNDYSKFISELSDGANINNLRFNQLQELKVPVPPLAEQNQIVTILDDAFAKIDHARQLAERNLKNARELFDSSLNQIFTQSGDGWVENLLMNVCEFRSGNTIDKKLELEVGDVLYAKVGDMNLEGNIDSILKTRTYVERSSIKADQIIPEGSVVFPKRGGAIATNKKRKIVKPTIVDLNTMAITPPQEILFEYFYYWFLRINLESISNGTTVPQINNYSFEGMKIVYPSSYEQSLIISRLQHLEKDSLQLKKIYQQKITALDELKQSLLQKAFRGELTQVESVT